MAGKTDGTGESGKPAGPKQDAAQPGRRDAGLTRREAMLQLLRAGRGGRGRGRRGRLAQRASRRPVPGRPSRRVAIIAWPLTRNGRK